MAKHTLKILRCEHRKIFKVCLAILHYARKGSDAEKMFREKKRQLARGRALAEENYIKKTRKKSSFPELKKKYRIN